MLLCVSATQAFNAHVLAEFPNEACGLIIADQFLPCANIHENPATNFRIDHRIYLRNEHSIQAVLHSHVRHKDRPSTKPGDARSPSLLDMQTQLAMAVPWGIASTEGESVSQLVWWGDRTDIAPLLKRPFIFGIADCYTLVRDYYFLKCGLDLPEQPRGILDPQPMYIDNFVKLGFRVVTTDIDKIKHLIQVHDAVLIKQRSGFSNHAGIYDAPGMLMQHSRGRFSERRPIDHYLTSISHVLRHESMQP